MSLIEVRGLRKIYGGQEVLRGIDLTVEPGERIAIIGGSGCGKGLSQNEAAQFYEKSNARSCGDLAALLELRCETKH